MTGLERRFYATTLEARKSNNGKTTIGGHAAVFNSRSQNLGGFYEVLSPGAFSTALADPDLECYSLFNHEPSRVLAVNTNGSLRLDQDKSGLSQETDLDGSTGDIRDMAAHVESGRIKRMSFAMQVAPDGDEWDMKDGDVVRSVNKISVLADVSPVTYAAYKAANIGMRSLFGEDVSTIMSFALRAQHNLALGKTEFDTLRDWQKRINDLLALEIAKPESQPEAVRSIQYWKAQFDLG